MDFPPNNHPNWVMTRVDLKYGSKVAYYFYFYVVVVFVVVVGRDKDSRPT